MSNDAKDLLYGKAVREHREQQRLVICLHEKRDRLACIIRHEAERLYEDHCYKPQTLRELPSTEERCHLINEIEAARKRLDDLAARVEETGAIAHDLIEARSR